METTLDKLGRIVIPRQLREDLGLRPGIRLQIEECQEEIRLKPIHGEDKVVLKDNVLVFTGDAAGDGAGNGTRNGSGSGDGPWPG